MALEYPLYSTVCQLQLYPVQQQWYIECANRQFVNVYAQFPSEQKCIRWSHSLWCHQTVTFKLMENNCNFVVFIIAMKMKTKSQTMIGIECLHNWISIVLTSLSPRTSAGCLNLNGMEPRWAEVKWSNGSSVQQLISSQHQLAQRLMDLIWLRCGVYSIYL